MHSAQKDAPYNAGTLESEENKHDHELSKNKRRISEDSVFKVCGNPQEIMTALLS